MARQRAQISVTFDHSTLGRLDALVALLPGSNRSNVLEEVVIAGLPVFEAMAAALVAAKDESGVVDDQRARDAMAQWAGAQLLGLHHTGHEGGEDG